MKSRCLFLGIISVAVLLFFAWYAGYREGIRHTPLAPEIIHKTDTFTLPSPVSVKEVPVEVPADVDTAAILADYYTQRMYNDTIIQTEMLSVTLHDTVYNNMLLGRKVYYTLDIPIIDRTNEISLSADIGKRMQLISVGYQHKNITYKLGYDFYNRTPTVGVAFTLKKW